MSAYRLAGVIALVLAVSCTAFANPTGQGRGKDRDNERGGLEPSTTIRSIELLTRSNQLVLTSVLIIANTEMVLGGLTSSGVRRVDENRFDLGGMPLLGGLFGGDDDDRTKIPVRIGDAYLLGPSLAIDLSSSALPSPASSQSEPAATDEERSSAGASIEKRIREVLDARPALGGLTHQLDGDTYQLDRLKLLNDKYSYQMPSTAFVSIGRLTETPGEAGGKIPLLGDIPLLGGLFRQPAGSAYLEHGDLVVVIRPSILEDQYD